MLRLTAQPQLTTSVSLVLAPRFHDVKRYQSTKHRPFLLAWIPGPSVSSDHLPLIAIRRPKLSTLLYSTLLNSSLPSPPLLSSPLLYSTLLYSTLLYSTLLDSSLLYSSLLSPLLSSTLVFSTLVFSAPLSSPLLSSPLLYSNLLNHTLPHLPCTGIKRPHPGSRSHWSRSSPGLPNRNSILYSALLFSIFLFSTLPFLPYSTRLGWILVVRVVTAPRELRGPAMSLESFGGLVVICRLGQPREAPEGLMQIAHSASLDPDVKNAGGEQKKHA